LLLVLLCVTPQAVCLERFQVSVCDATRVPPEVMQSAKTEVSRAFYIAGVDVVWLRCTDKAFARNQFSGARFVVRVRSFCPGRVGTTRPIGEVVLPASRPPVAAREYQYADTYYGTVAGLAGHSEATEGQILGWAMAHEIGHFFLGVEHTPNTVMAAEWNTLIERRVMHHSLCFSSEDGEAIATTLRNLRLMEDETIASAERDESSDDDRREPEPGK
jgi:hypothetical protein